MWEEMYRAHVVRGFSTVVLLLLEGAEEGPRGGVKVVSRLELVVVVGSLG